MSPIKAKSIYFFEKYNYDLVNGLPLHQNGSCLIFGEGRQNLNAARRALGKSGNFILFDTSCRLLDEFGTILETRGYEIKILNLCDLQKSNTYNPFDYLKTEPENQVTLICPSERIKNVIDNAFINDTERYQIKQHVDTPIK